MSKSIKSAIATTRQSIEAASVVASEVKTIVHPKKEEIMSTRTPEQEAAIAALRNEKEIAEALSKTEQPAFIADSVASSEDEDGHAAQVAIAAVVAKLMDQLGFGENSIGWKRKLAAFFSVMVLTSGAGYAIGTLAGYAIVGIASLGGSMLWSYLVMIIAMILAVYAGMKIGQYVGNYILSGQIDTDLATAKNKVFSWFKKVPLTVAPAELVPA